MIKLIINILPNIIVITGNTKIDSIMLSIIKLVSFVIAFGLVERISDILNYHDSQSMSDLHWTIRLAAFIGSTWFFTKIAQFIYKLADIPMWYLLIIGILTSLIVIIRIIKYFINRKELKKSIKDH